VCRPQSNGHPTLAEGRVHPQHVFDRDARLHISNRIEHKTATRAKGLQALMTNEQQFLKVITDSQKKQLLRLMAVTLQPCRHDHS